MGGGVLARFLLDGARRPERGIFIGGGWTVPTGMDSSRPRAGRGLIPPFQSACLVVRACCAVPPLSLSRTTPKGLRLPVEAGRFGGDGAMLSPLG